MTSGGEGSFDLNKFVSEMGEGYAEGKPDSVGEDEAEGKAEDETTEDETENAEQENTPDEDEAEGEDEGEAESDESENEPDSDDVLLAEFLSVPEQRQATITMLNAVAALMDKENKNALEELVGAIVTKAGSDVDTYMDERGWQRKGAEAEAKDDIASLDDRLGELGEDATMTDIVKVVRESLVDEVKTLIKQKDDEISELRAKVEVEDSHRKAQQEVESQLPGVQSYIKAKFAGYEIKANHLVEARRSYPDVKDLKAAVEMRYFKELSGFVHRSKTKAKKKAPESIAARTSTGRGTSNGVPTVDDLLHDIRARKQK